MHYTVRTREGGKHGVLIPLHARILEKSMHHVYFKQFSSCMRGFDDFLRFSRKEKIHGSRILQDAKNASVGNETKESAMFRNFKFYFIKST